MNWPAYTQPDADPSVDFLTGKRDRRRRATGEICLPIDPDRVPAPGFPGQVLPRFENAQTGFVPCEQVGINQKESMVAYGAARQTYSFYGPLTICMSQYSTARAIGAAGAPGHQSGSAGAVGAGPDRWATVKENRLFVRDTVVPVPFLSCSESLFR